ncbi:hypothetical protein LSHI6S_01442 [Leifsonia shinshuensis]
MWVGVLRDESEDIEESSATKGVGIMMLSEEFVASRVYAGDVQRAERDRELVRRLREERAERRAERRVQRQARTARADGSTPAPEPVAAPVVAAPVDGRDGVPQTARETERELAHAGR